MGYLLAIVPLSRIAEAKDTYTYHQNSTQVTASIDQALGYQRDVNIFKVFAIM